MAGNPFDGTLTVERVGGMARIQNPEVCDRCQQKHVGLGCILPSAYIPRDWFFLESQVSTTCPACQLALCSKKTTKRSSFKQHFASHSDCLRIREDMFWKERNDGWEELSLAMRMAVVLRWGTRRGLLESPQCPFCNTPRTVGRKSLGEHFKKTRDCWDRLCVSFVEYVGEIVLEDEERDARREDALIRGVV